MKIAVFYHCRISGGAHPASHVEPANPDLDRDHAAAVVVEQAQQFFNAGIMDAADAFTIGLNGTSEDFRTIRGMFGPVNIVMHTEGSASELPTLELVESFAKQHPGYYVLYCHSKGVRWSPSTPGWELRRNWRRCMTHHIVKNWEQCIAYLQNGCDMVGTHWLTQEKYPSYGNKLGNGIWGGNFWWATSEYLAQLAPLLSLQPGMDAGWLHRYWAEHWTTSARPPKVYDFADHWPPDGCPNL